MKKIISLVLCAIMLLGCLPMMSFADEVVLTEFTNSNQISSGDQAVIAAGTTFTIAYDETLYVPSGASLTVKAGGTLIVNGTIIVMNNASLVVEGDIKNGQNVKLDGDNSVAIAEITYASIADYGASGKIDSIKCFVGDDKDADLRDGDKGLTEVCTFDLENGGVFPFPLNKFMFLDVSIVEPVPDRPRFDESKFMIFFKGTGLGYKQGYSSCKVSNSGDLSFSQWTTDADFYKMCRIQLPSGEGYEVVGRDCEVSSDGTVYIKYGEPFSFRVEIDEAYDMSNYEVYIYNGYGFLNIDTTTGTSDSHQFKATPTGDGWYTFSMLDSETGEIVNKVIGDSTVKVIGVVKNETINMIGDIIETIKSVFNMLKEFFEGIIAAFKGGI